MSRANAAAMKIFICLLVPFEGSCLLVGFKGSCLLVGFKGKSLPIGKRDALEQELRLAVATRTSFERHLVAHLRDRPAPPLRFKLAWGGSLDNPFLARLGSADALSVDQEQCV